jgi:[ribosomal protein S5]-alanine N-acetyltransferase
MLTGTRSSLRPYREDDIRTLPNLLNDYDVARWMTAAIPHPYTAADARAWIAKVSRESPTDNFAVEVDGVHAGGIGIRPHIGERSGVAEFGYWLGRSYWGRGIATEAARLIVEYAFRERNMRRLEAHVFAPNLASACVLEKCGFIREAVSREALTERNGAVVDCLFYACLVPNSA